jgi:hypothetical protein
MSGEHLVVARSFVTEMEAVTAKSALESAGIIASIRSDSPDVCVLTSLVDGWF